MKIQIYHLLEGAEKAEGTVVVIDVFRAFSLEAYMFQKGVKKIFPVKTVEEAFALKKQHPEYILCGERNGKIVEGFDVGNSPSQVSSLDLNGKCVIHTTSAGVQGLVSCIKAERVLTGALVNAKAVAEYIRSIHPDKVSLVAMGLNGSQKTDEDELCARYIQSLLQGSPEQHMESLCQALKETDGKKFFDPLQQSVFPKQDFYDCIRTDSIDVVLQASKVNGILTVENVRKH